MSSFHIADSSVGFPYHPIHLPWQMRRRRKQWLILWATCLCANVGTGHSWQTHWSGWITHHFGVVLFHYRKQRLFKFTLKFLYLLNLAQHLQPADNLLAPLLLPNVCGKMTWTPPVYKWRVPLKSLFSTIKKTMVTVQNHANMSVWTKYLLSHKAKRPFPALVVLTLHQCKCKQQQLIFRSHANSNHQYAFVLPS
jgi:hypothetical protein